MYREGRLVVFHNLTQD